MPIFAEQYDADFRLVHVECHAEQIAGNFTNSSKPTARKAGDLCDAGGDAGDRAHLPRRQLRRECFPHLAIPAKARSKNSVSSQASDHWRFVSGLGSSGLDQFWPRSSARFGFRLGLGFRFRFVFFFQKFTDILFQRGQIIRDAPSNFLSTRRELYNAHQVGRGLEPHWNFSREGLVDRILYCGALLLRQVNALRTTAGPDPVFRAAAISSFALPSIARRRR